jgi:hypothetical protein
LGAQVKTIILENLCKFVFPGHKSGAPLSAMALEVVLRRMQIDDATVHGFRSAFRDWAAECTNFPNEVCGAALAPVIENRPKRPTGAVIYSTNAAS